MRRFRTTIVLALATLLSVSICSAQQAATTSVPNLIRYSGTLKDAQGAALSSSTAVGVTFAIYKQQDGGAAVWMETQNVTPDGNGQYSVVLGSTTATGLPGDLFSQQEQRWLGVQLQGQDEQARVLLVSVPYAFKAHEAETLGGLPASAFVKAPTTDASGSGATGADNGTSVNALSSARNAGGTGASAKAKPLSQTSGFIPVYNGSGYNDSLMSQALSGATVVNVSGGLNLSNPATAYQIGGHQVLSIYGFYYARSLSVGLDAGGSGQNNTSTGTSAGHNTYGNGNTFTGAGAGQNNTDGSNNVYSGYRAGGARNGSNNTFSGYASGYNNNANGNSFYGYQAGYGNTTGGGNSFFGYQAGSANQTGKYNTFIGDSAGAAHVTGDGNTYVGSGAGQLDTGSGASGSGFINGNSFFGFQSGFSNVGNISTGVGLNNTFIGYAAGFHNTIGSSYLPAAIGNTFVGNLAGNNNTTGSENTFVGDAAGHDNNSGINNTYIGSGAGYINGSGNNNIIIGYFAGFYLNYGHNNIYMGGGCGNQFVNCVEYGTIRIGTTPMPDVNLGGQNATFIAGIYGHGTSSGKKGKAVYISSDGKLGTYAAKFPSIGEQSSLRFKEQIADMDDSSSRLFQLRPVTFFDKLQYDDGSRQLQYGLIAEEVVKVYPEMVERDTDGQLLTVRYELLAPMLLNELQKQHTVVAAQQDVIKGQQEQMQAQQQQIEQMQQRLSRLEALIATK